MSDLKKIDFAEYMQKVGAEEAKPRTKAEIVALLKANGEKFAALLEALDDSFLAEVITLPPGRDAADADAFRHAARGEGTRDAPSRPADADASG